MSLTPCNTGKRYIVVSVSHCVMFRESQSIPVSCLRRRNIYRKWNERLFLEMYEAFKDGRTDKDPTEFWYNGEIGFFDFYM